LFLSQQTELLSTDNDGKKKKACRWRGLLVRWVDDRYGRHRTAVVGCCVGGMAERRCGCVDRRTWFLPCSLDEGNKLCMTVVGFYFILFYFILFYLLFLCYTLSPKLLQLDIKNYYWIQNLIVIYLKFNNDF
jgi:hypothetical protein